MQCLALGDLRHARTHIAAARRLYRADVGTDRHNVDDPEKVLPDAGLGVPALDYLGHHGLLTTGKTLEEAVYLAILLQQAAQLQVRASSIGAIRAVNPERSQEAHDFLLRDKLIDSTFDYWARRVARKCPEALA